MKRIIFLLLAVLMALGLCGCALLELFESDKSVVDLGKGEEYVRWNLVANDNEYRPVDSAYFEFNRDTFKYYENGILKKEGTHRITYFGVENSNAPLHLNLNFGKDESGFSVYDYIDCYTEDKREDLHQFTVVSEGYHIEPLRSGGVPIRDYHLSDMPYAFGTYVREGREEYTYENGRVNYLGSAGLCGRFRDENGNVIYLMNNSYSKNYQSTEYSKYTVYMRYESNDCHSALEGTLKLSWYEDWDTGERIDVALIHVMHGENEPAEESGVSLPPDYQLMRFSFGDGGSISFQCGEYFHDNRECSYNPTDFIGGTYFKVSEN